MAQAERLLLPRIGDLAGFRQDALERLETIGLAARRQRRLELPAVIEMVLDGRLPAAGHEDQLLDSGGPGLFRRILDKRLVHHR
jgi:hypothetical protein